MDFPWETVIAAMKMGNALPIVGPELAKVQEGGQVIAAEEWLVRQFFKNLKLDPKNAPSTLGLAFKRAEAFGANPGELRGQMVKANLALFDAIAGCDGTPPTLQPAPELKQFVSTFLRTPGQPIFISLTPDATLAATLALLGRPAHELPNGPVDDLPSQILTPQVYHLFGRIGTIGIGETWAKTENERFEALYEKSRTLPTLRGLSKVLNDRQHLYLGLNCDDGFGRMLIRTLRQQAMGITNPMHVEVWSESPLAAAERASLIRFLGAWASEHCYPYADGMLAEFISKLDKAFPAVAPLPKQDQKGFPAGFDGKPLQPNTFVFISYCWDDKEQVRIIAQKLLKEGIQIWFDERELDWGAGYPPEIDQAIKNSAFFLPVLTQRTVTNPEEGGREKGFFMREWRTALDERKMRRHGKFFRAVSIGTISDLTWTDLANDVREDSSLAKGELIYVAADDPDFDRHVKQLKAELDQLIGRVKGLPATL